MPKSRRIALLSKKSLDSRPYARWLHHYGIEIVLIAEDSEATRRHLGPAHGEYADVMLFSDWKRNRAVDQAVAEAHRRDPLTRVVSLSECDVVRAAQLREWLDLPGQRVESALAFRDKVIMKDRALAAGVAVPRYRRVDTVWDLVDFAAETGVPVVVKPVDGAGAVGVTVLRDEQQLQAWIAAQQPCEDEPLRLIAEEYIGAPLLSVDGIMADGAVLAAMVSSYLNTCHGAVIKLEPVGLLQAARGRYPAQSALTAVRRLLAGFPTPAEPTSFHCELFAHPERGMLLCEIAARTGGARVREMAEHALGGDIERRSCLGQAGIPADALMAGSKAADDYIGFVALPGPGRRLVSAPSACPLPGVAAYTMQARPGQHVPKAAKVSQLCADVIFRAADADALQRRCQDVLTWLDETIVWEDERTAAPLPVSP